MKKWLIWTLLIFHVWGCTTVKKPFDIQPGSRNQSEQNLTLGPPLKLKTDASIRLYPTEFKYLAGWQDNNHQATYAAFQGSCTNWRSQTDAKPLAGIFDLGRIADWKKLCDISVANGAEQQFFEKYFQPFAIADSNGFEGLFTGYYLPELHGAYKKSVRYQVPIYGIPDDLVIRQNWTGRVVKGKALAYFDRAEIAAGALAGKQAEILWVDNEIDAYFLEVQGSGRVIMEDGKVQGVSFAAKNGLPYYAIGKDLVEKGIISRTDISMQSIRAWLEQNPEQGRALMLKNPSKIFFRLTDASAAFGPKGSMNVALTAGYSLAVDSHYFPLGVPLWLDAEHPSGKQPIRRLLIAQDTGSAIKGVLRGDVYWGQGQQAAEIAGVMKSNGRLFLLKPR